MYLTKCSTEEQQAFDNTALVQFRAEKYVPVEWNFRYADWKERSRVWRCFHLQFKTRWRSLQIKFKCRPIIRDNVSIKEMVLSTKDKSRHGNGGFDSERLVMSRWWYQRLHQSSSWGDRLKLHQGAFFEEKRKRKLTWFHPELQQQGTSDRIMGVERWNACTLSVFPKIFYLISDFVTTDVKKMHHPEIMVRTL